MVSGAEGCTNGLSVVRYGDAPSLLLIAAGAGRIGRRAAAASGFRIAGEEDPGGTAAALARRGGIDLVLVDAADADAAFPALLAPLAAASREGIPVVICAGMSAPPAPDALSAVPGAIVIPPGDATGLLQALHEAAAPRPPRFHDVKNHDGPRLQQLSEEVGRIATILASLSEEEPADEVDHHDGVAIDAAFVRSIIRVRRLRDHYFRSAMFADPAWDMLLDLFAARLERQRVAVSSLCIAAAVPATTALRWIKSMTDQNLFVRVADPQDGRRVFIELSDEAAAGLESYLRAAQRISPLIV